MQRFVYAIALVLLLAPAAAGREQSLLARVTVYWHSPGPQQRAFSTGAQLRTGHCAVDPKKIPYGSKVVFPDTACVAVDTGPAVVSRKAARLSGRTASERNAIVIDRFFESKQAALAWANSHPHFMTVQVLSPKSHAEPRELPKCMVQKNPPPESNEHSWTPISNLAWLTHAKSSLSSAVSPIDIRGPLIPTFLAF
jgi:3D (Asp-Asp-Asp) domain-containing protein